MISFPNDSSEFSVVFTDLAALGASEGRAQEPLLCVYGTEQLVPALPTPLVLSSLPASSTDRRVIRQIIPSLLPGSAALLL